MSGRLERVPWLACGVVLAAGVMASVGEAAAWAIWERGSGTVRWWSGWTTHAVHVSAGHALASGSVWLVAAALVERASRCAMVAILAVGAPVIAWAALAGEPEMGRYVGLSGLACAVLAWLGAEWTWGGRDGRDGSAGRWLGPGVLAVLAVRTGWDFLADGSGWLMTAADGGESRVARWAHTAGALVGIAVWTAGRLRGWFGKER